MRVGLTAALLCAMGTAAGATELITTEEAALPAGDGRALLMRAITRGPGIQLVAPGPALAGVHSPFELRLSFVPRGAARILPDSVKVVYDRQPPVDLSERLRTAVSETGIVLTGARAPVGQHRLKVTVADSDGRTTTREVNLNVLPR